MLIQHAANKAQDNIAQDPTRTRQDQYKTRLLVWQIIKLLLHRIGPAYLCTKFEFRWHDTMRSSVSFCSICCEVTGGLAESSGSLPPGLWLTPPAGWLPSAKNRNQLRNPTLGNRVWGTFTFTFIQCSNSASRVCSWLWLHWRWPTSRQATRGNVCEKSQVATCGSRSYSEPIRLTC